MHRGKGGPAHEPAPIKPRGELRLDLASEFLAVACNRTKVFLRVVFVNADLPQHHVHRGGAEIEHCR
jgi:hypothetical protein